MDKTNRRIEIPFRSSGFPFFVLEGTLDAYSTKDLHDHSCHQILRISTGITLLVEEDHQQPLFSNMTAFIPAGRPHRSIALGDEVGYKSIYLDETLFRHDLQGIAIFDMSQLGVALFDRINNATTIGGGDAESLDAQCINLLLKLMQTEVYQRSPLTRIPVPRNHDNLKITAHINDNFHRKIKLFEFTDVLPYSQRHLSRRFKDDLKITIFEYLKLYRIYQSALMLCRKDQSMTITQIALACGYDSLSSFYKDFKQIFAMTPKAFSERNGEHHRWESNFGS